MRTKQFCIISKYTLFPNSDLDHHDTEPSSAMMDLYWYKLEQLRDHLNRVYNHKDIKRLSSKLVKEKCGVLGVRIFISYVSK